MYAMITTAKPPDDATKLCPHCKMQVAIDEPGMPHADQDSLCYLVPQCAKLFVTTNACPPEVLATAADRLFTVSSALRSEIFRSS